MADEPLSTSMIVWVGILREPLLCWKTSKPWMARVRRTRWTLGQSLFDASGISTCVVNRIAWIARDDVKEERCKWKMVDWWSCNWKTLISSILGVEAAQRAERRCSPLVEHLPIFVEMVTRLDTVVISQLLLPEFWPFVSFYGLPGCWWLTFFVSVGENIQEY